MKKTAVYLYYISLQISLDLPRPACRVSMQDTSFKPKKLVGYSLEIKVRVGYKFQNGHPCK